MCMSSIYYYVQYVGIAYSAIFKSCRTCAEDRKWEPYEVIRKAYNFQAHESSAFIKVTMLLAAAYGSMGLRIEPEVVCNVPLKKTRPTVFH